MQPSSIRNSALALLFVLAPACAGNPLQPRTLSSAPALGYAVQFPESETTAAAAFEAHRRQAHELTTSLPSRAPVLKPGDDASLYSRVIEEADADGKRASFVRARDDDRAVRAFWASERAALGARVASTIRKQQGEQPGCTPTDPQPAVQQALRDGLDRPLDKRLRAESEAERLLERYQPRLTPATWQVTQRVAADLALASYLVNVALIEDLERLRELQAERSDVADTLERGRQEEQAIQAATKGAEQKASRERLERIDKSQKALSASAARADAALQDYEQQLRGASEDYERARAALEHAGISPPATANTPAK